MYGVRLCCAVWFQSEIRSSLVPSLVVQACGCVEDVGIGVFVLEFLLIYVAIWSSFLIE